PAGSGPTRTSIAAASAADASAARTRARRRTMAVRPAARHTLANAFTVSPLDLNRLGRSPAGYLRRVHFFDTRRGNDERSGCRRANDVRELVMTVGKARGEEQNAIVVTFHVIERAAAPDVIPPELARSVLLVGRLRDIRCGRGEPRFHRLEPRGDRVGDR